MTVVGTIQVRRGTTAEWAATNPVMFAGEWGLDTTLDRLKIGDGAANWAALPFYGIPDAPTDGLQYVRIDANWAPVSGPLSSSIQGYLANASTTPPPAPGGIRFNNASQPAATVIYINYTNEDGVDLKTYYTQRVKTGDAIYIQDRDEHAKWQLYEVTGAFTDNTTYAAIPVVWRAGGTALTAQRVVITREGASVASPIGEAPNDGKNYGRKSLGWSPVYVQLTQAAYDALSPPDANTLYVVVG